MALMQRTRMVWRGFNGAPGVSTFYSRVSDPLQHDARLAPDTIRQALQQVAAILPDGLRLEFPQEHEVIEDTTGQMQGFLVSEPAVNNRLGVQPGPYSAASGAAITWHSLGVRNGRRVQGRTFIVPLSGMAYEDDGSLSTSTIIALQGFADAISDPEGPQFLLWSRPTPGQEGASFRITSGTIRDQVAVLRSRRD